MNISHRYRFVFLATSHAASTSIGALLKPYADIAGIDRQLTGPSSPFFHHINAVDCRREMSAWGYDWAQYRHFCVVRNPFDRVVSLYHFSRRFAWHPSMGALTNVRRYVSYRLRSRLSFDDFVLSLNLESRPNLTLKNFICGPNGEELVEDILRFEELSEVLPLYLGSLGLPSGQLVLPRDNVSTGRVGGYRDYYTRASRERVERLFAYEIQRFGYEF